MRGTNNKQQISLDSLRRKKRRLSYAETWFISSFIKEYMRIPERESPGELFRWNVWKEKNKQLDMWEIFLFINRRRRWCFAYGQELSDYFALGDSQSRVINCLVGLRLSRLASITWTQNGFVELLRNLYRKTFHWRGRSEAKAKQVCCRKAKDFHLNSCFANKRSRIRWVGGKVSPSFVVLLERRLMMVILLISAWLLITLSAQKLRYLGDERQCQSGDDDESHKFCKSLWMKLHSPRAANEWRNEWKKSCFFVDWFIASDDILSPLPPVKE